MLQFLSTRVTIYTSQTRWVDLLFKCFTEHLWKATVLRIIYCLWKSEAKPTLTRLNELVLCVVNATHLWALEEERLLKDK